MFRKAVTYQALILLCETGYTNYSLPVILPRRGVAVEKLCLEQKLDGKKDNTGCLLKSLKRVSFCMHRSKDQQTQTKWTDLVAKFFRP